MNIEKIREDFPILEKDIVYFDNACMTLRPKQVIEKMNEYYYEYPACAGRSSHKLALKTEDEYNKSRHSIAKHINAKENEIIFTRNTTEGLNLVANSLKIDKKKTVLTTDREHNSNLVVWQLLKKKEVEHKIFYTGNDFDLEKFKIAVKNIKLVSFVHTSNLDGYTLPVKEIIKIAHDAGSLVMLDAAQSMPHKQIDVKKLDVDFLAFSGHKMLGPSIGCLFGKEHLLKDLEPFIVGGDTVQSTTYKDHVFLDPPEKFEAGLQNYAGAIGLAEAVRYLDKIGKDNIEKNELKINKFITQELEKMDFVKILGPSVEKRSSLISFNVDKINFHDIALMFNDMKNIMIRSGQHCVHSWFDANNLKGSARASFYLYNTIEEASMFVETLNKIARLR